MDENSLASQLGQLANLRDSGALTDAEFTMAKARLLQGTEAPADHESTSTGRGHWEYEEFTESLVPYTGGSRYSASVAGWNGLYDGGVPNSDMREPIKRAVRALLNRASRDGWEPIEPIDPDRLWNANRISFVYANDFLDNVFANSRSARLQAVHLNCRRWSEDVATPRAQPVDSSDYDDPPGARRPENGRRWRNGEWVATSVDTTAPRFDTVTPRPENGRRWRNGKWV